MNINFAVNHVFTEEECKNFTTECETLKDNEPEETDEPRETSRNGVFFSHKLLHKMSDQALATIVKTILLKCVEIRQIEVLRELRSIQTRLKINEIETHDCKIKHSLAANKDFVFITGGDSPVDSGFEILALGRNDECTLFEGPNFINYRHSHISFIFGNYLYIMLGLCGGSTSTMTYKRIEIPSPINKKSLDEFYEEKEWESGDIASDYNSPNYIKCFNWFKSDDNTVYVFGEEWDLVRKQSTVRVTISCDPKTHTFKAQVERLSEEDFEAQKNDKKSDYYILKECVHLPFVSKGEWYLPIIARTNHLLTKWSPADKKFTNFEY